MSTIVGRGNKRQALHFEIGGEPMMEYGARTKVYDEGAPAGFFYEVLDGVVMISKIMADGRRQIVEVLGPGSLFGMTSCENHPCQAEALTPVRVSRMPRSRLTASPDLQMRWCRQLLRELEAVQNHALLLGRKSALGRVAWFLLSLPQQQQRRGDVPSAQDARATAMTQAEIGDYLGLEVPTISRALAALKKRMLIKKGRRGHFRLLDVVTLRALADH